MNASHGRLADPAGPSGFTMLELLLAGALGVGMLLVAGLLVAGQIRGYQGIQNQAKLQTQTKRIISGMIRDLGSAGAGLANPREDFYKGNDSIQIAYKDLKGRNCALNEKVKVSFYLKDGVALDSLMQKIQCGTSTPKVVTLARAADIDLDFDYFKRNGYSTGDPNLVGYVRFELDLESKSSARQFKMRRNRLVRVEFVNFP